MAFKIFGSNPSGKHLERLKQSPQYKENGFKNISETPMMTGDGSMLKTAKDFLNRPKTSQPGFTLPSVKTDLKNIQSGGPLIVWFGHSSYFIRINHKNFLIDPVFSGSASPFSFMVKSFAGSDVYTTADLPAIDFLILTHDHYDHLDYKTILQLESKVNSIYCSLGVSSHLACWGFNQAAIHEMDWWQTEKIDPDISLTAAPARHFSGRGLTRGKTLWSSFILKTSEYNLFLGGDSGYDEHFKQIGEKFGPFDIAILECGQYNKSWAHIHMMPEETAQAAVDLKAKVLLPVHWGKFTLALHEWDEPVKRVLSEALSLKIKVTTPMIGEPVILNASYPDKQWWKG
ncbi:MAG TPA: MBL fold metallo-hydrolase [Panacibacter sp.]|nr:MBL fold metallo-hydrolase [Panacibacter sp.]